MITATMVADPAPGDWRGHVKLYALSEAQRTDEGKSYDHVLVSAADAYGSGPETYVFAADEEANVVDWLELPGSFRGGFDHDRAIEGYLRKVNE